MLIPIAAGIAAAVSSAFPSLNLGVTDRYLMDVDAHAKDLIGRGENFIGGMLDREPLVEADAMSDKADANSDARKVREPPAGKNANSKPPPLPKTDEPLTLLGLDALYPPESFDEIKAAYKKTIKIYHPDLLGPDASEKDKERASDDFRRINEAFETLKKREEEPNAADDYSYDMVENGERVTKATPRQRYQYDPYHIDFDRIRQNAEYFARNRKRMWYEDEFYYGPPIESHQSQRERWWQQQENDFVYEYDDAQRSYATPSDFARRSFYNQHPQGFGYNRNDVYSGSYQADSYGRSQEGFHKERDWIHDQFDNARYYPDDQYDYYQSRQGYERFKDKWWTKGYDEYDVRLNGEFGP